VEFEWDENKTLRNEEKHGISIAEATTVFGDPMELTIADPNHSTGEYRFLSIGRSSLGNLLVVSYTEREENHIRIISARRATKHEQKYYE
jgi:uncharacterized protein